MKKLLSLLCLSMAFIMSSMAMPSMFEYPDTRPPVVYVDNHNSVEVMGYCFCNVDVIYETAPVFVSPSFDALSPAGNSVTFCGMRDIVHTCGVLDNRRQCNWNRQHISLFYNSQYKESYIYSKMVTIDMPYCLLL